MDLESFSSVVVGSLTLGTGRLRKRGQQQEALCKSLCSACVFQSACRRAPKATEAVPETAQNGRRLLNQMCLCRASGGQGLQFGRYSPRSLKDYLSLFHSCCCRARRILPPGSVLMLWLLSPPCSRQDPRRVPLSLRHRQGCELRQTVTGASQLVFLFEVETDIHSGSKGTEIRGPCLDLD